MSMCHDLSHPRRPLGWQLHCHPGGDSTTVVPTRRPSATNHRRGGRDWRVVGLLLLAIMAGCSRTYYRRQADQEVYGLVRAATHDPRWRLEGYTIQPKPESRFYDPNSPDHPPMPPDDPTAHQLMHCVDCRRGARGWHRNGDTPYVENPAWRAGLPYEDDGAVALDRAAAMRLALLNSPDYQQQLEELYLSALDVTFQRFRLDAQFFGGHSTFFTADGPARSTGRQSLLDLENNLQMRQLWASGGTLVVDVANSLMWQFAGPDEYRANTLLDFSIVQPLLRAGGRKVVLEGLTESERTLLANIRQMEFFRHAFYTQIIAGSNPGPGPTRGAFDTTAAAPLPTSFTSGILGLLRDQVLIRNQRETVRGLQDSVNQIEAYEAANRIDTLQADFTRQALYNAQRGLLTLQTAYQDRLDAYKVALGLPPDLQARIQDPLLHRFDLVDPEGKAKAIQAAVTPLLQKSRREYLEHLRLLEGDKRVKVDPLSQPVPAEDLEQAAAFARDCEAYLQEVVEAVQSLEESLPARAEYLRNLQEKARELAPGWLEPRTIGDEALQERFDALSGDFAKLVDGVEPTKRRRGAAPETKATLEQRRRESLRGTLASLQEFFRDPASAAKEAEAKEKQKAREELNLAGLTPEEKEKALANIEKIRVTPKELFARLIERLNLRLLQLTLVQGRARLEMVWLVPVEMAPEEALQTARENRLDWMNARGALVDKWRQVRVTANALRGDVNVTFNGDMSTTDNNPIRFRSTTGRLRVGVQFDPPLTRLAERNLYREALINYQQARRTYYSFEDRVNHGLRITLRSIQQAQVDFELRRIGVLVAFSQVDITRERLNAPPQRVAPTAAGEPIQPGGPGTFGPTTARDLVTAYSGLLSAANDLVSAWIDYEADRLSLDLNMGTMQLDADGQWVDPGPIKPRIAEESAAPDPPKHSEQDAGKPPLPEEIPSPDGVPVFAPPAMPR